MFKIFSYYFVLITSFLLWLNSSCFAQEKETIKEGVSFSGEISIRDSSAIGVFGNISIETKIEGEGEIKICGKNPQKIIAKNNSSVNKLSIENASTVSIVGNLEIKHSFTHKQGTIIIEKGSALLLPPTCEIKKEKGSIIVDENISLIASSTMEHSSKTENINFPVGIFFTYEIDNFFTKETNKQLFITKNTIYKNIPIWALFPPPRQEGCWDTNDLV